MPHKRNPVSSEQICGLARVVRANSLAALENIALWHERDISHSSVERVILPDSTILVDYMLHRTTEIVANMKVFPERMLRNLTRRRAGFFRAAFAGFGRARRAARRRLQVGAGPRHGRLGIGNQLQGPHRRRRKHPEIPRRKSARAHVRLAAPAARRGRDLSARLRRQTLRRALATDTAANTSCDRRVSRTEFRSPVSCTWPSASAAARARISVR